MRKMPLHLFVMPLLITACSSPTEELSVSTSGITRGAYTFKLEGWADNWFAVYLGDELIMEDSVSISTERSFNAEAVTFAADYPLHLNFILKDYIENDTGLEYIGASNQQMGDGGFIMQLTDVQPGELVAVSNSDWACLVIHEAPLDKSCEAEANPVAGTSPCEFAIRGEPDGWKSSSFDDSTWTATTAHAASVVGVRGGYDLINWSSTAEIILGSRPGNRQYRSLSRYSASPVKLTV